MLRPNPNLEAIPDMTTAGWIVMIFSTGTVSLLFIWCIYKIISTPGGTEHMHGFEQETPDEK